MATKGVMKNKPGDPLTNRQAAIYDFIKEEIEKGLPPTVREIMREFNMRGPNGVVCHLKSIQQKGYIRREKKARGIFLTELTPENPKKNCAGGN